MEIPSLSIIIITSDKYIADVGRREVCQRLCESSQLDSRMLANFVECTEIH